MADPEVAMETRKESSSTPSDKGDQRTNSSEGTAAIGKVLRPDARTAWSVTAVRGKVTDRCLWTACKAMTAGVFLIVVGAGMATLGFYSGHLSRVEEQRGNTTVWVKNESRDSHLGSLTYFGPVVMGIGGFTIVAACVMTFEARDTAAKIVPVWFRRTRIHAVPGSGSTPSGRSSKTSWERFLAHHRSTSEEGEDSRSAMTQALLNFSKYLQSSVDAGRLTSQHGGRLQKCPSEPNLAKLFAGKPNQSGGGKGPESVALLEANTPTPSLKPPPDSAGGMRLKTLSAAAATYRQAVSMDCPRSPQLTSSGADDPNTQAQTTPSLIPAPLLEASQSCTDSNGSLSVDIYLPKGSFTLRVRDETKGTHLTTDESTKGEAEVEIFRTPPSINIDTHWIESTQEDSVSESLASAESTSPPEEKPRRPSVLRPPKQESTLKRHPLMRQVALEDTPTSEEEPV